MEPEENAAGTTPDPTITYSGTGTTSNLPDDPVKKALAEAEEWKKRFAGLQGKYQQEQNKWTESAAKMLEFDEQNKKLSGELEAIRAESAKALEEKDVFHTDLELKSTELDRLKIIMKEFPHLIPLLGEKEEDDVLPDGTGDELRGKLKTMSEKINTFKQGAKEEHRAGESPSNPPASVTGNEAKLRMAIDAMKAGNMAEYNKLYAEYIESSKSGG